MPLQNLLPKLVATVFGIGYTPKGGGTVAAILYCVIWYFLPVKYSESYWQFFVTGSIVIIGFWSANVVDKFWGTDSSKVVIDEVAGMSITLMFVPHQPVFVLTGLVAFRFFDIVKPLGIKKMEHYPKGWGVMADDILAGIYALLIVNIVMFLQVKFK